MKNLNLKSLYHIIKSPQSECFEEILQCSYVLYLVCFFLCFLLFPVTSVKAEKHDNLLKNSSFEDLKEPNRYGLRFPSWTGWIFEPPATFALGDIAQTGKHSALLIADKGAKIRLMSEKITLEPGRYKVSTYLRGLDVGPGNWQNPLDFSLGFDGKYHVLPKSGSFDWTKIFHVFKIEQRTSNFFLNIGLLGGGWLWVDDIVLERVSDKENLTEAPVIEESEPLDVRGIDVLRLDFIQCEVCGFKVNREGEGRCVVCGHRNRLRNTTNLQLVKVLADFENGMMEGFTGGSLTSTNAPQGKLALISRDLISLLKVQDWSDYDVFAFDVYNPSDTAADLFIELRDRNTTDYWTRVNYKTVAVPGYSQISLPTSIYVGEKSRPGRQLLKEAVTHLFINPKGNELVIDNIRLEKLDTSQHLFAGLYAFDFGRLDSPLMEGFLTVTSSMQYHRERGYGWINADIWKSFNVLQPDTLYQDFICPRKGVFRVNVPNGTYQVILNIDSPGGYWGEVQKYDRRKVLANGREVVDEMLSADTFKNKYFHNAKRDDFPGINAFVEYVQPRFSLKKFIVDVQDGIIDIAFQGEGFAHSLSSMVIFPTAKQKQGEAFISWVDKRRETIFNDYFKQISPIKTGPPSPAQGYRLFARNMMEQVNAFDGPNPGEEIRPEGLALAVAGGEESAVCFSLQPSRDLGQISLDLTGFERDEGGQIATKYLPKTALQSGWLDYRIKRVTMEGSVYTVSPGYWRPLPAPAGNVTRTFWVRVKIPSGFEPGIYRGTIAVKPAHAESHLIPIAITVLPFSLDAIADVAVGPWGSSIDLPWFRHDASTLEWNWEMFDKSLDSIRQLGFTSFSGIPNIEISGENGQLHIDFIEADKEMALARQKGFSHLLSAYGASIQGYRQNGDNNGPDSRSAIKFGFPDVISFLTELYREIDEHALENNWIPVAWNLFDEPIGGAIEGAKRNAIAHRSAQQGLKMVTFMGATSMFGNDPKDPHYDLIQAIPIASLNNHDEKSLKVVSDAGNRLSFYNGGNRWTYGRYMRMLVAKHELALRLSWHFNNVAGDPYYALDCREDDYCWFNTDEKQNMVPSIRMLREILPGLNDYRYLVTLKRLLDQKAKGPGWDNANSVYNSMISLAAGKDRTPPSDLKKYDTDRQSITHAILQIL